MKNKLALILILISGTSFGQNSSVLGKKNEIKILFQTNPFTAKNRTYFEAHELANGNWSASESDVYNYKSFQLSYSRVLTRRVSLGVNYLFGYGKLGRVEDVSVGEWYNSGPYSGAYCFNSPNVRFHDVEIVTKVHFFDHSPFGFYTIFGLGSGLSVVKEELNYFFNIVSSIYTPGYKVDAEVLLYNFDFVLGVGGNIFLSKNFSLNLECDFKIKGFYHTIRNEFDNFISYSEVASTPIFTREKKEILSQTKRHKNFTDAFNLGIGISYWF